VSQSNENLSLASVEPAWSKPFRDLIIRIWPAALFLPFPCNKEQQTAANRGTKRRLKIAKFYE